jgi:hypothetical protein
MLMLVKILLASRCQILWISGIAAIGNELQLEAVTKIEIVPSNHLEKRFCSKIETSSSLFTFAATVLAIQLLVLS